MQSFIVISFLLSLHVVVLACQMVAEGYGTLYIQDVFVILVWKLHDFCGNVHPYRGDYREFNVSLGLALLEINYPQGAISLF